MNEIGKSVKVTARHIDDEAEITFRKSAGDGKCTCRIEACSASAALNGIGMIVGNFAAKLGITAPEVLAVLAASMARMAESEAAE